MAALSAKELAAHFTKRAPGEHLAKGPSKSQLIAKIEAPLPVAAPEPELDAEADASCSRRAGDLQRSVIRRCAWPRRARAAQEIARCWPQSSLQPSRCRKGGGRMNLTRIYLRASTDHQDAGRARAQVEAFAAEHGLTIATAYTENESGASLAREKDDRHRASSRPRRMASTGAAPRTWIGTRASRE